MLLIHPGLPLPARKMMRMDDPGALTLLPEVEARRLLGDRPLVFRLLAPPYPALGVGTLRLLRLADRSGRTELCAGYDRYERLPEGRN